MTMKAWKLLSVLLIVFVFAALAVSLAPAQGPKRETGDTVAKPRRPDAPKTAPDQPAAAPSEQGRIPSKFGKKDADEDLPQATFRSDVLAVTIDVAVLTNNGQFIPNLPRDKFRVLEDGVPQQVSEFSMGEAPMTIAMVIEFSNLFQQYWSETWYQTLTASYGFLETLRPDDYVAVVAYDMRPEILSDFSTDKRKAHEAMQRLRIAAFSESNLFDAVTDTAERMEEIEGRKAIVLISSGMDTFSKKTFGETRKILQRAGVPIYAIGLMQALREWYDARGFLGPLARLDFLQADNQMRTFANETGGQSFFPRFYGEFPSIFGAIADSMRHQYTLVYNPTNQARDGQWRKIEVQLVDPASGQQLRITDQKGKNLKYKIVAKKGYTAPRPVE
jgi:Ca-activated chloride channel homolog